MYSKRMANRNRGYLVMAMLSVYFQWKLSKGPFTLAIFATILAAIFAAISQRVNYYEESTVVYRRWNHSKNRQYSKRAITTIINLSGLCDKK